MTIDVRNLITISVPYAKYTVQTLLREGKHLYVSEDLGLVLDAMAADDKGPDNDYDKMLELENAAKNRVNRENPTDCSSLDILDLFLVIGVERGVIRLEPPKS